jgi:hypothetical protein
MTFKRMLLAALMAACVGQEIAWAQAAPMTQWGLIGAWSSDCARPASGDHYYSVYEVRPDGAAFLRRENGGAPMPLNPIPRATILGDGSLLIVLDLVDMGPSRHTRELIFAKGADGRVRAMSNRRLDGDYSVRDGKLVSNGADMPWQSRCR